MSEERIYYNKLSRDKIPENIAAKGVEYEVKTLSEEEFQTELLKKVVEEAIEVSETSSHEELISEIADLEDVLEELKSIKSITAQELQVAKDRAFAKKGGFKNRTFLVWAGDDGYKSEKK